MFSGDSRQKVHANEPCAEQKDTVDTKKKKDNNNKNKHSVQIINSSRSIEEDELRLRYKVVHITCPIFNI